MGQRHLMEQHNSAGNTSVYIPQKIFGIQARDLPYGTYNSTKAHLYQVSYNQMAVVLANPWNLCDEVACQSDQCIVLQVILSGARVVPHEQAR